MKLPRQRSARHGPGKNARRMPEKTGRSSSTSSERPPGRRAVAETVPDSILLPAPGAVLKTGCRKTDFLKRNVAVAENISIPGNEVRHDGMILLMTPSFILLQLRYSLA